MKDGTDAPSKLEIVLRFAAGVVYLTLLFLVLVVASIPWGLLNLIRPFRGPGEK